MKPITPADAAEISRWRYEKPYSVYDGDPASVASLLEPRFRYHAVHDEDGRLVGYFCFGEDARVAAGRRLGLYDKEEALDVGLGLRPDLTGKGLGPGFVRAGLRFAKETYAPPAFRVTVAASNRRAVRAYEKAGFHTVKAFGNRVPDRGPEWLLMRRDT